MDCIHHFALEVKDVAGATELPQSDDGEIISEPGVLPVKLRAPGGTCRTGAGGRYRRKRA